MVKNHIKDDTYIFSYEDIVYENNEVSPELEVLRYELFRNIVSEIKKICIKHKLQVKKKSLDSEIRSILTRIIFNHFSKKIKYVDGFFPYADDFKELTEAFNYTFTNDTQKAVEEIHLADVFKEAITIVKKYKIQNIRLYTIEKKDKVVFNSKLKFTITHTLYNKLKKRYLEYKQKVNHSYLLDDLIYCLLVRYNTLHSLGHQWGIPTVIKDEFKKLKIDFECFASSLNHYYKYYCSMFYDIEKYFMSIGYFQNVEYIKGGRGGDLLKMKNSNYVLHIDIVDKLLEEAKKRYDGMNKKQEIDFLKFNLLGCEYIEKLDTYYVFDILIHNYKSVVELNLKERRALLDEDLLRDNIKIKEIYNLDNKGNVFTISKSIYKKYEYDVDGIIYTPIYEPYYNNVIYKWKPLHLQTIDFLIREVKGVFQLFVSSNNKNVRNKVLQDKEYTTLFPFITNKNNYFPSYFATAKIKVHLVKNKGSFYGNHNNILIKDNTIVEFYYVKECQHIEKTLKDGKLENIIIFHLFHCLKNMELKIVLLNY